MNKTNYLSKDYRLSTQQATTSGTTTAAASNGDGPVPGPSTKRDIANVLVEKRNNNNLNAKKQKFG